MAVASPHSRLQLERIMKKTAIANDPEVTSQRERCTYYVRSFRWSGDFVQSDYDNLGEEGCSAYDPADLDRF